MSDQNKEKYKEFLRGLRKSDRDLFLEILEDIEKHKYLVSDRETTLYEDILLGFLANQRKLRKIESELNLFVERRK